MIRTVPLIDYCGSVQYVGDRSRKLEVSSAPLQNTQLDSDHPASQMTSKRSSGQRIKVYQSTLAPTSYHNLEERGHQQVGYMTSSHKRWRLLKFYHNSLITTAAYTCSQLSCWIEKKFDVKPCIYMGFHIMTRICFIYHTKKHCTKCLLLHLHIQRD